MILLDTNILIEIFKGNSTIATQLENINDNFGISSITQMELYYGAFNKREINLLDKLLANFYIYHLTPAISLKAVELIKTYSKSHNLTLPDALIAATAIVKQTPLITLNLKDFKYIEELELIKLN
jgi:predicted nucleic acid-binding protein